MNILCPAAAVQTLLKGGLLLRALQRNPRLERRELQHPGLHRVLAFSQIAHDSFTFMKNSCTILLLQSISEESFYGYLT